MGDKKKRIWGVLLHLGTNMWSDVRVENRVTEGFYKWGGEDGWALYSDEIRFDQVPAGMANDNFAGFFEYSRKVIPPERFKGMMNTVWCFTQPHRRDKIFKAIDQVAEAKTRFGS